jgi:subtilisin family serine protease
VRNSITSGVTYAIAAGNSNANAGNFSPARVGEAITVGSSTINDARSSFSNFGSVVDIFAPGSSITSAWATSDTATRTISGTSMATPHVAGVAARYLQTNTGASAATVRNALVAAASLNRLSGIPSGTANRLLFRSPTQ